MARRNQFPKQTTLTLAITAALSSVAAPAAAVDTTVTMALTTPQGWNSGNFTVTNTGSIITPSTTALSGFGSGGTLSNSGTISGRFGGYVSYGGAIDTLNNATGGTITGIGNAGANGANNIGIPLPPAPPIPGPGGPGSSGGNGLGISGGGTITTLNNSGMIGGIGGNGGAGGIGIVGGNGGNGGIGVGIANSTLITSLTNAGTISGTGGNGGAGAMGATGGVGGSGYGIQNSGAITTLSNTGTISGTGGAGDGGAGNGYGYGINNNNGSIGALTNSGTISGDAYGIQNTGTINALTNSGGISGGTGVFNDYGGAIGTLTNRISGTISGGSYGVQNAGTINALNNSGSISGGNTGVVNNGGTIGALTNSGSISGAYGIYNINVSTIGTLANSGIISGTVSGVSNANTGASIGTLTNSGTISGGRLGIYNSTGTINALTNTGIISGTVSGISNTNTGLINALTNSGGTISGGTVGISNSTGTINSLTNNGIISGGSISSGTGIYNDYGGTIGTLTNTGTISGQAHALFNGPAGTLGTITNAGVIAGNIENQSSRDLNINGGSGATFGTLTGLGGTIGTLTNTSSNVVFGSGNLLLNDRINVGSNAVNNTGATLQVNAPMTITGNYNQGAAATLQIGVNTGAVTTGSLTGDSGYGRLVVSGAANIASGSAVTFAQVNPYPFAPGQRYVIVDASSTGTHYNEGTLRYSIRGYNSVLTGANVTASGRSDLVVTVVSADAIPTTAPAPTPTPAPTPAPAPVPTIPPSPATAPNALSALTGLSQYTGINDPGLLNLFNAAQALNLGSSASANSAGTQLSPVQQASATGGAAAPTLDVLNLVSARADSLRLAKADRGTGIATGESPLDLAVWGQGFGGHANQSTRDQVDGYGATYGGLMIGADKGIGDAWRAGGVFSYSNTLVQGRDNSSGDSTRINGYGLTGYANYTGKPWYVNLSGGVVQQRYNTNREINFTGFSGIANGSFSGQQYVARAEGGYPLAVGNTTVTPLASLTYSHLNQDSYTETGGNGAALSVGATHATSLRSSVGAKLEQGFETAYGKVIPQVQLQWVHEFNHNPAVTSASFAADPSGQTAFTTVGATQVSNLADLTLGVTLLRANNLSLSARYELQLAKGFVSQTGSLRLRQQF